MNRTKIEWVKNPDGTQGYTWNPITGCLNGCSYCYARKLANGRLKERYRANHNVAPLSTGSYPEGDTYANPFYPRFWEERLYDLYRFPKKKSVGIFVCDMGELFGDWLPRDWQDRVMGAIMLNPQHRFYLLTKQPQNLIKWSPFPENCWVGVTATDNKMAWTASKHLSQIEAKVKFLSIEPLLSWKTSTPYTTENIVVGDGIKYINWVIIGACTGTMKDLLPLHHRTNLAMVKSGSKWTLQPETKWVEEIVEACDKAGVKVFLKDNLEPMLPRGNEMYRRRIGFEDCEYIWQLRQEMPE